MRDGGFPSWIRAVRHERKIGCLLGRLWNGSGTRWLLRWIFNGLRNEGLAGPTIRECYSSTVKFDWPEIASHRLSKKCFADFKLLTLQTRKFPFPRQVNIKSEANLCLPRKGFHSCRKSTNSLPPMALPTMNPSTNHPLVTPSCVPTGKTVPESRTGYRSGKAPLQPQRNPFGHSRPDRLRHRRRTRSPPQTHLRCMRRTRTLGPTENFIVASISDNMWRISRIRAIEGGIFANGFRENIDSIDAGHPEVDAALVASDTWTRQAKQIMLLSVYETRLTSILRKDPPS